MLLSIHLCLQIIFDNKAHSGKIKIYFDSDAHIEECKDLNISGSGKYVTCSPSVDYGWFPAFYFWIWGGEMVFLDGDRRQGLQRTTSWAVDSVKLFPKCCTLIQFSEFWLYSSQERQHGPTVRGTVFAVRLPGFGSLFCFLWLWSWAHYLSSPCLSMFLCKMRAMIYFLSRMLYIRWVST